MLPNLERRGILNKTERGILNPRTARAQETGPDISSPAQGRRRSLRCSGLRSLQLREGRPEVARGSTPSKAQAM
jgi:hypothetical protein